MKKAMKRKLIRKLLSGDVHKKGAAITTLASSKRKIIAFNKMMRESEESIQHCGIPLTDFNSHWSGLDVI